MPKTYQYPEHGTPKHRVRVADDGAILVRRNDFLGKYSMAIHGRGDWVYEYGRKQQNGMQPIQNVDLIRTGETIYHLPTYGNYMQRQQRGRRVMDFSSGPAFIVRKKKVPTQADTIRQVEEYLQKELKMPPSKARLIGPILLGANIGASAFRVLAWDTLKWLAFESARHGASTIGMVAAPFIALASAGYGLYVVVNTKNNYTHAVAFCHGVTAWVYGAKAPPRFPERLKKQYQYTQDNEWPEIYKYWDEGAQAGFRKAQSDAGRLMVAGKKLSPDVYKVAMRLLSGNDSEALCKMVAKGVAARMGGRPAVKKALLNLINNGFAYRK